MAKYRIDEATQSAGHVEIIYENINALVVEGICLAARKPGVPEVSPTTQTASKITWRVPAEKAQLYVILIDIVEVAGVGKSQYTIKRHVRRSPGGQYLSGTTGNPKTLKLTPDGHGNFHKYDEVLFI